MSQNEAYPIESPVRKNGRDDYSTCSTAYLQDLLRAIRHRGGAKSWIYDVNQHFNVCTELHRRGAMIEALPDEPC